MQRNWDVIRKILIKLEEKSDLNSSISVDEVDGYDTHSVGFHMQLLNEAGLIEAVKNGISGGWKANSIRWAGYELLDKIRQDTVWNKVKATAREKSIDLSFDAIGIIANKILSSTLG
jgi:hypothetical protein